MLPRYAKSEILEGRTTTIRCGVKIEIGSAGDCARGPRGTRRCLVIARGGGWFCGEDREFVERKSAGLRNRSLLTRTNCWPRLGRRRWGTRKAGAASRSTSDAAGLPPVGKVLETVYRCAAALGRRVGIELRK